MIWIILIVVVIAIVITKRESKVLNDTPFIHKYPIVVSGINEFLFNGEAEFESKDSREHYLFKNSLSKKSYVQFIYRQNSVHLKFYEDFMEIKTTYSFYYSDIKHLNDDKQFFIAKDFSQRVKSNSKVAF